MRRSQVAELQIGTPCSSQIAELESAPRKAKQPPRLVLAHIRVGLTATALAQKFAPSCCPAYGRRKTVTLICPVCAAPLGLD